MIHYNYSPSQLERKATELLTTFDPQRLKKAKPIDVYEVIEKCLNVPYDWKYITPDQSIWGMTFFRAGYYWVWPCSYYEDGMEPKKAYYDQGAIVIDSFLTELSDRGPENFTVMHEVFHQVLHKRCFAHSKGEYKHETQKKSLSLQAGRTFKTSLEICEYQANFCAACFLMPKEPVVELFSKMRGMSEDVTLKNMASEFNVSKSAMRIRLQSLNLLS